MSILEERVWAGSETSLQAAAEAEANIKLKAGVHEDDDEDDESPRLLEVTDGVGVISIKGPLVNSDSPYLQYFGVTGYPEIREAMLAAAGDPEVKQILLDIDSGGGAVSGCDDTAKLIRMVNDRVKPVSTYTDGVMASAACWLGVSAGRTFSSKSALVGSIGVIATHREYVEANKMEGIGVTVIRAGKHKALANSNEKLTAEGRAQIQQVVDASYTIFVEHVAEMRGKSYEYADKTMADGQEFIGQAAVDIGLTDGLTTFDALMTDLKDKVVASENNFADNRSIQNKKLYGSTSTVLSGDKDMAKKALTEADIAALAAGATPAVVEATIETPTEAVASEGTPANTEQVAITAEECVVKAEDANASATVQLLSAQLKEKDAALLEAGIKLAKLEGEVGSLLASADPLKMVVARSMNLMRINLSLPSLDASTMSAADVLAEHERVAPSFVKNYQVGGVAAVSSESPSADKSGAYVMTNVTQAQIDAVRGK